MIKFKLKKEARQFFSKDLQEKIKEIEFWDKEKVHQNLLQQVDNVYIDYGIKTSSCGASLKGWDSNNDNPKAHFDFTVHVQDITNRNYEKVSIPEMIDEMQKVVNRFFISYVESVLS